MKIIEKKLLTKIVVAINQDDLREVINEMLSRYENDLYLDECQKACAAYFQDNNNVIELKNLTFTTFNTAIISFMIKYYNLDGVENFGSYYKSDNTYRFVAYIKGDAM